jgi:hypothetical protein
MESVMIVTCKHAMSWVEYHKSNSLWAFFHLAHVNKVVDVKVI